MDPRQKARHEEEDYGVGGMIANAPTNSKRGTYLKLPPKVKWFNPAVDRTYRLLFMLWKAGQGNSVPEGKLTCNRYLYVHKNVGPDEVNLLCPAKHYGKPCPSCQAFAGLRTDRGQKWEVIKQLKPQNRELWLVHDLDEGRGNLYAWEDSSFLFGDHLRKQLEFKPQHKDFAYRHKMVEVRGQKKQIQTSSCNDFNLVSFEPQLPPELKMPSQAFFDAVMKLCPDGWLIEPDMEKFRKAFGQTGGGRTSGSSPLQNGEADGEANFGDTVADEAPADGGYGEPEPVLEEEAVPAAEEEVVAFGDEEPAADEPSPDFEEAVSDEPPADEVAYEEVPADEEPPPVYDEEPVYEEEPPPPPAKKPAKAAAPAAPPARRPAAPPAQPAKKPAQQPAQPARRPAAPPAQPAKRPAAPAGNRPQGKPGAPRK